jgi:hypothetical protein
VACAPAIASGIGVRAGLDSTPVVAGRDDYRVDAVHDSLPSPPPSTPRTLKTMTQVWRQDTRPLQLACWQLPRKDIASRVSRKTVHTPVSKDRANAYVLAYVIR